MRGLAKFLLVIVAIDLLFATPPDYRACGALTALALVMWVIER